MTFTSLFPEAIVLHTGVIGPCAWSVIHGTFDDQTTADFLVHLRALARDAVPGQLVLDFAHGLPMPTAVQRRQIVEVLKDSPRLDLVAGHALVINTPIGRGLLTAINWVVRPPFEEKVFSQPNDALRWLEERNPELDSARLMQSVRRVCPEFDRLRW